MRQVFTSPRLENVERVAELLRADGIEVRILNGRSYKGARRSTFSYREDTAGAKPSVWVIRSDDQTRARAVLRDAGLLQNQPSTRSYLGQNDVVFASERPATRRGMSRASKVRYTLLGGAALVVALTWFSRSDDDAADIAPDPAPVEAPGLDMVPPTVEASVHRIAVPQALAEAVLVNELSGIDGPVCLAIDGDAPTAPLLARLEAVASGVRTPPGCAGDGPATWLEIANYRTDGSGTGTVDVITGDVDTADARVVRTLDVARDRRSWRFAPAD